MFKLGLVINPYAGIGGALALKGSDGVETREKAIAMGAEQRAMSRTSIALDAFIAHQAKVQIYTASGDMGETLAKAKGFLTQVVYHCPNMQTEAQDTENTVKALLAEGVDVILFAGGDGTARNVCHIVQETAQSVMQTQTNCSKLVDVFNPAPNSVPVLGIPAGCKIHSGVYAVTPHAAGRVIALMIEGQIVSLQDGDVMDIDENAFREGTVKAKKFGEMRVPDAIQYVQAVKVGGKESEELVLMDIAAQVMEMIEENDLYVMGSGSTVAAIMDEMGLDNTLLGVDVVQHNQVIAKDVTAKDLLTLLQNHQLQYPKATRKLVITLIGGQGHIFGRGNQQLSPEVIRFIGKNNILLVATKTKLNALNGRPLIADTGDTNLDQILAGYMPVTTGYRDQVLYKVGG